jgi:hypothetical protein
MNHQPPRASTTTRHALYLVALALLLSAALFSIGCDNKNGSANTPPGNSNTNPQLQPTNKPDDRSGSDEPVVITGGSIDEDFNDGAYIVDPSNPNKFTCTNCKVTGPIEITAPPSVGPPTTTCPVPSSGDYTITLDGGGAKKDILISIIGNTVVITSDKGEYKPTVVGGLVRKRYNGSNKIKGVRIKPAGGVETNCTGVPANGKCIVKIPVHKN